MVPNSVKAHTKAALSDPCLIRTREQHLARLEALFAGERLDHAFVLQGIGSSLDLDSMGNMGNMEELIGGALDGLALQADKAKDPLVFRPLSMECWLCGVHFTDRLFGAEVWSQDGQWWSHGLSTSVGELQPPDLDSNETWRLARLLAETMVGAGVTVPFIATQVLGAPLNQTFNIRKENLLYGFHENPDAVRRDLRVVTDTLIEMHQWYRRTIPPEQLQPVVVSGRCQPRGFGQMCGCATQLVSGETYREFIAPLDEEVLSVYPHGGMYHLCGSHTQHIPAWREMTTLRAVQINDRAAEDLELYFNGLRDDQILYLNPSPTMTVDRAMAITGGRRLVICADVTPPRCTA